MKVEWASIQDVLVDPLDHTPLALNAEATELVSESGHRYSFQNGQPILLPVDALESGGWRFEPIAIVDADRPRPSGRSRKVFKRFKRLLRGGVGRQGAGDQLVRLVTQHAAGRVGRVLVIGGASVGDGSDRLVSAGRLDVLSFDVYPTDATTFVADGHRIPLADSSMSAVWIQAVLEHVYRPEVVVSEIVRVLEPGGFVYAETPFMQPVHEGAYDYLRFSQSGHRLLFGRFDEVASGPLGGPGAVLNLGVRGLVGGLTRSTVMARLAYAATQPLVLLDRFVPEAWRVDYCTGSFFLGRRSEESVRDFDPVGVYHGVG